MLKLLQESCCSLFLGQIIRMEVWMGLLVILSLVMEVIEASNLEWALNVCHITLWLCPPLLLMRGLRSRLERLLSIGNIYACSAEVILIPQGELLFLFWNGRIRLIKTTYTLGTAVWERESSWTFCPCPSDYCRKWFEDPACLPNLHRNPDSACFRNVSNSWSRWSVTELLPSAIATDHMASATIATSVAVHYISWTSAQASKLSDVWPLMSRCSGSERWSFHSCHSCHRILGSAALMAVRCSHPHSQTEHPGSVRLKRNLR
jgi:hypothetical protein